MNAPATRSIALFPLDPRCLLLTNLVWEAGADGVPSLHRQKLWARFPRPVTTAGLIAQCPSPVGRVRVETAEDEAGSRWRLLAEAVLDGGPRTLSWPATAIGNIRVHVVEPAQPGFPQAYYFTSLELLVEGDSGIDLPRPSPDRPARDLTDRSTRTVSAFAGAPSVPVNQQLGLAHDRPRTDRVEVTSTDAIATFATPVFRMAFSRRQALVTHLGWDAHGKGRQDANLLSTGNTRGAFPVVMRDCNRLSSESCGGSVQVGGRNVAYRDIRPVPEIDWSYDFQLTEKGFTLEIGWRCNKAFIASEIAALRLPFDLYRSVVNVLAMPETSGPSGLVAMPLVINAPNHGAVRVSVRSGAPVLARILPLRVQAELWLDLIPGARPLPSGVLEMPAGEGSATLDFELTRIFPFGAGGGSDLFSWWELPPFYSFAERETVLGALGNGWLNGLAFRPDLGRFANNSVADSAALCASYYADIAAYTPLLAPVLDPRGFIRVATEQILRDHRSSVYSNWRHFPMAATSPIDCAWLYVASSGDWEWARRWRDSIAGLVEAIGSLEHTGTGLVAAEPSGIPEEAEAMGSLGNMQCQWADSLRSGHLESYVNAHAFRSLGRAAELLERLHPGDALAAAARDQAERLRSSFLSTFHDRASGQVIQWIARDGRRFGFHSHMHLGAAIALGLVPDEPARDLLRAYLARLEARGFNRYEWGLPMVLDPIPAVCHNNWKGKGVEPDGSDQYGVYQNGAVQAHQTWYLLQALYRTGLRAEANRLFTRMTPLVRDGGLCGGLHSGVDWRHPEDGRPTGYEGLLAEQFHFLLAAITGYLGCELTIDGLAFRGPRTGRIAMLKPDFARMALDPS
jgi:hypothetical protein